MPTQSGKLHLQIVRVKAVVAVSILIPCKSYFCAGSSRIRIWPKYFNPDSALWSWMPKHKWRDSNCAMCAHGLRRQSCHSPLFWLLFVWMLHRIPAIESAKEEKPSLRWSSYAESISDSIPIIRANPYMYRKAAINMHLFIYLFI